MTATLRYRKKPITVDTIEWTGKNIDAVQAFVGLNADCTQFEFILDTDGTGIVWAEHEQCWVAVPIGHRIVRGALDEHYPISPQALAATYDLVTDTPEAAAA